MTQWLMDVNGQLLMDVNGRLAMTRAELMRHALSQALRRVHVGPKKLKLDEETRWQIAGEAVEELRRYGGWKELDEEAPMRPLAKG